MKIRPASSISESSYPTFFPHITIAALPPEFSVDRLKCSIPKLLDCLPVSFCSIDVGSHFFRSVYISVQPTDALLSLHAAVHAALEIAPRTPLFPHISLCYITDEDAILGERDKYYRELESTGKFRSEESGGVSLNTGEDDWMSGFLSPELWITDCTGPVEAWSVVEIIQLNK